MEPGRPPQTIGRFVLFLGLVSAMGSLGLDAILPVLPDISRDLGIATANHAQLVVMSFAFGMGLGNLIGGPLSDSLGRRPVILTGCLLYAAGSICAGGAPTLAVAVIGRIVQGIGAAFAAVATTAMVRDEHSGNAMAKIMSFAMVIFAMMPAIAPFIGKFIAALFGWRMIFGAFVACSMIVGLLGLALSSRVPSERASLSPAALLHRAKQVIAFRDVRLAITAQTFNFGILLATLSSIQPIFDRSFHSSQNFPEYFAVMTLGIAISGFINGRIVGHVGAKRLTRISFAAGSMASATVFLMMHYVALDPEAQFILFLFWAGIMFFLNGFTIGNLNAVAMEPVGKLAGMASSLVASLPMIAGSVLATPVGLAFDGSPARLVFAAMLYSGCAAAIAQRAMNGVPRASNISPVDRG